MLVYVVCVWPPSHMIQIHCLLQFSRNNTVLAPKNKSNKYGSLLLVPLYSIINSYTHVYLELCIKDFIPQLYNLSRKNTGKLGYCNCVMGKLIRAKFGSFVLLCILTLLPCQIFSLYYTYTIYGSLKVAKN